ncbi:hypothetical protein BDC45DRAFT_510456 [Circinella umbellata]|nr:hypothetical protein BDC45DRAFT_510456 [Circinella umbellata]
MRNFTSMVALVSLALFAISSVSATSPNNLPESVGQSRDVNLNPIKRQLTDKEYCESCDYDPDDECMDFCYPPHR